MRNAFVTELESIASHDKRIVLLSADMGNRLFDNYKKNYPERFFNCGVAEANMMSMAAGMALCGMLPITYTITPFITVRCLEQIKVDVCYHNLPVIIVGMGSGLSYAELGPTHHSCDDIAFLRILPNIKIVCPGDSHEVRLALRSAVKSNSPVYIRLGKKGEPIIHKTEPEFNIGRAIVIFQGSDVCLLSTGNILPVAVNAAEELKKKGISAGVVSYHTVKPLDKDLLLQVFSSYSLVVTLEEHSIAGGFGSSVAEWLVEQRNSKADFFSIGVRDEFFCQAGNQGYARKFFGLTTEAIAEKIIMRLKNNLFKK